MSTANLWGLWRYCTRVYLTLSTSEVSTFNFQDLIVNSPLGLWLLLIYLQISYENLVLDQDNKFYPISLSILKGMDIMGRS